MTSLQYDTMQASIGSLQRQINILAQECREPRGMIEQSKARSAEVPDAKRGNRMTESELDNKIEGILNCFSTAVETSNCPDDWEIPRTVAEIKSLFAQEVDKQVRAARIDELQHICTNVSGDPLWSSTLIELEDTSSPNLTLKERIAELREGNE